MRNKKPALKHYADLIRNSFFSLCDASNEIRLSVFAALRVSLRKASPMRSERHTPRAHRPARRLGPPPAQPAHTHRFLIGFFNGFWGNLMRNSCGSAQRQQTKPTGTGWGNTPVADPGGGRGGAGAGWPPACRGDCPCS